MSEKKTYRLDVAYEYIGDGTFEGSLDSLLKSIPEAEVRILAVRGLSGGWPDLEITVSPEDVQALKVWYLGEDSSDEDFAGFEAEKKV
jgi:hypothetical protein